MMEKSCAERVRDNLKRVEASIADACRRAGRAREEVTLSEGGEWDRILLHDLPSVFQNGGHCSLLWSCIFLRST